MDQALAGTGRACEGRRCTPDAERERKRRQTDKKVRERKEKNRDLAEN